ncbi:PASTA domain-containing protein [Streptomyces sp. NPDC050528]|uniref:PASTA domain-containing protein n=1 Tax=Streptomyces sp. NPDC050528 TaxID=3365623 RepID=UPI0037B76944
MNDFANTPANAPHFDATGNRRGTRRRRAGVIAATAIAIALAGTGAALATVGTASHTTERTSTATTMTTTTTTEKGSTKGNVTTVPYAKPFDLKGVNLAAAEEALAQAGLTVGTVTHGVVDNCKPGSVIAVSPLAPTVLHNGDKIDLALCG